MYRVCCVLDITVINKLWGQWDPDPHFKSLKRQTTPTFYYEAPQWILLHVLEAMLQSSLSSETQISKL